MKLVSNATGSTSIEKKIETFLSALIIVSNKAIATTAKIKLALYNKKGASIIIPNLSIHMVNAYAVFGEGVALSDISSGISTYSGSETDPRYSYYVKVGMDDMNFELDLDLNEYIQMELTGLDSTAAYDIIASQTFEGSRLVHEYVPLSLDADEHKDYSLENVGDIIWPAKFYFDHLTLTENTSGRSIERTPHELFFEHMRGEDYHSQDYAVANDGRSIFSLYNIMDAHEADRFRISGVVASGTIVLVKPQVL